MEFQVAETVEELESQHSALKQRIAAMVKDEDDAEEIASLLREKAALAGRITIAKAERDRAGQERRQAERGRARAELPGAIDECKAQRDALLEHTRGACIAWGNYINAMSKARELVGKLPGPFGPMPEHLNALHSLELGDALQRSVADLEPDMGAGWKLSFTVAPKYEKHRR